MYRYFREFIRIACVFAGLVLAALLCVPTVGAQSEEELGLLKLYYRDKDLVFTPTRTLQPISRTAENLTIITSDEIENMNAHTLTDVLTHVTGVQVQSRGGPGSGSSVNVQGSQERHVLFLVDGVKLNNLSENWADVGSIPVQMIERIEILKGPGSSTWGSSLGGVVNVITKAPDRTRRFGGTVAGSAGERRTGDYRAETTGTLGAFGYYVYAGHLTSGGFVPQTSVYENNAYAKFSLSLPKGSLAWTGGYIRSSRGEGRIPEWNLSYGTRMENLFSTLSLSYSPTDSLDLDVSLRAVKNGLTSLTKTISDGASESLRYGDRTLGGSAKASYRSGAHSIVAGTDVDDGRTTGAWVAGKHRLRTVAFFANDAIAVGPVSIIPGIRYDHTNTNGGFVSPSLGIAYKVGEHTTVRAYSAKGFNIPPLSSLYSATPGFVRNPDLDVEKVTSCQVGIESWALKHIWFKTTLFRHDISDAITTVRVGTDSYTVANAERQRRQGLEVEAKTRPVYDFSLAAGATYLDSEDRRTGDRLPNSVRYSYDVGVEYNNDRLFSVVLKGHYIRLANTIPEFQSKDRTFVWDIHVARTVFTDKATTAQAFLSVRNLFRSHQYIAEQWPNPSRWMEAGLRVEF